MADGQNSYSERVWWSNDGLRLYFRDYPALPEFAHRPPVICIPGLTRNSRDFANVAANIAGQWRVICVDLRGRGESGYAKDPMSYVPLTYIQDIEALLRAENIEHFVGFGTSLGGLITMLMASTRPGRVVGALLNDVGPELNPDGLARIRDYVGQGRSFPTWMHAARAIEELHGPVFPSFGVSDWLDAAKKTMKLSPGGRIVYDYDMKIAEPFAVQGADPGVDLWPTLAALADIPTLLVRGGLSDVLSDSAADRMMHVMKQGEQVVVPDVGHAPLLEEPEVTAAIARMLDRVAATQPVAKMAG
ncbi:MAG: alpha/beta hydrolase [Blastomonas sp.]